MRDKEWDRFVEHARREAIQKISDSALVVEIAPDEVDVKISVELGAAILLDKPILIVVMPGRKISEHLRRVADVIIEADIDTSEGRETVAKKIKEFLDGREGRDMSRQSS